MIRTIFTAFFFVLNLILVLILLIPYLFVRITRKEELIERYVKWVVDIWANNTLKAAGAKVKLYGVENIPTQKNLMFVSNHQGIFDIPLLLGYIPRLLGFIAKIEISRYPVLNVWMPLMHCIFMDRKDRRQSAIAIKKGIENIQNGRAMLIFPEGTRSKGSKMAAFKRGSFKMGIKSKAVIVPVTVNNTFKMFEQNNKRIKPAVIELYIHQPIFTADICDEELETIPEKVENVIRNCLTQINREID